MAVANKVVAVDLFDKSSTCAKVWNRLLTGVVMDALEVDQSAPTGDPAAVERLLLEYGIPPGNRPLRSVRAKSSASMPTRRLMLRPWSFRTWCSTGVLWLPTDSNLGDRREDESAFTSLDSGFPSMPPFRQIPRRTEVILVAAMNPPPCSDPADPRKRDQSKYESATEIGLIPCSLVRAWKINRRYRLAPNRLEVESSTSHEWNAQRFASRPRSPFSFLPSLGQRAILGASWPN